MYYYNLSFWLTLSIAYGYKTFTALQSVIFTNIDPTLDQTVHSEYFYGRCSTRFKILLATKTYHGSNLRGNIIVRGWLDVPEDPTCVYVRAKSNYGHIVRYRPMMFSMCICRIVYHYERIIYIHRFFEWFIPLDMKPDIKWDLFFYKLYTGPHFKPGSRIYNTTNPGSGR